MYIKSVSSCPLVKSTTSGLWIPDEAKRTTLSLSRRKFIKFVGTGVISCAAFSAIDSLFPQSAEAQWRRLLIPTILTGIELTKLLINSQDELGMFLSLSNKQEKTQEGNVGIRIVSI